MRDLTNITIKEYLFNGMTGCTDGNCIIEGSEKRGMVTNGGCKCLLNMCRTQLTILSSRISSVSDNTIGKLKENKNA